MTHDFTHLHLHTDGSLIDGLGPVARTVTAAKDLGFTALGVTDHGTLANAIAFSMECQHQGLKPIVGMEAYVTLNAKRFHLTLLADGNVGFKNLVLLNNQGQRGDDPTRPSFPFAALHKHADGLVVLTGCPASPFQDNEWVDARELALDLKGTFGDRLMAEVMFVSSSAPWERAAKFVKDLKLPPVVTNDVHFPYPGDAVAHKTLTQLKASFSYESQLLYLATPDQLRDRVTRSAPEYAKLLELGMRNAATLSRLLDSPTFTGHSTLPSIDEADETLALAIHTRLKYLDIPARDLPEYVARARFEFTVIKSSEFSSYFLILADIVGYAKRQGIRVGPGRGSGAGSLVAYLLGITEIDPIKYDLSFERFLNSKRAEFPDIDTDFESERRDEVLRYAQDKWHGLPIATYSRYNHKSLVHDLSRVFRVSRGLDAAAADAGPDSDDFKKIVDTYPDFGPTYNALLGQIHHKGQHAGGIVITAPDAVIPLERTADGNLVAAWTEGEHRELTTAGIVKFDLLGLSALSVLKRLEDKFGYIADPPKDNDPVFELFRTGNTTGIFQFSGSQGIIDFTKKVAPRTFEDLVAINALYRPGALDSGAAANFPTWRKAPRLIDPFIDDILAPTAGIICYQEQFMQIFARLTGGDMADADLARRVLSKARPGQPEWEEKMGKLRWQFINGAKDRGLAEKVTNLLWSEIVTHTRYSFNRSHAVAYTKVAWDMAWWRFHKPTYFFAALLSVDRAEWQRYLFELAMEGIRILPPHVNQSTTDFVADDTAVYLPLTAVKFLGDAGAAEIIKHRPFANVKDFADRVAKRAVTKRAREGLWWLGAFVGVVGSGHDLKVDMSSVPAPDTIYQQYMGMVIPTPKMVAAIKKAEDDGYVAGVITDVVEKESAYGKYNVYHMLPRGAFWTRDKVDIKVGDELKVKIRKDNGKILRYSTLHY